MYNWHETHNTFTHKTKYKEKEKKDENFTNFFKLASF
jgi:hypothetical protein